MGIKYCEHGSRSNSLDIVIPGLAKKKPGNIPGFSCFGFKNLFYGDFTYQVFAGNLAHTRIILGDFTCAVFVRFTPGFHELIVLCLVGLQLTAVSKLGYQEQVGVATISNWLRNMWKLSI